MEQLTSIAAEHATPEITRVYDIQTGTQQSLLSHKQFGSNTWCHNAFLQI